MSAITVLAIFILIGISFYAAYHKAQGSYQRPASLPFYYGAVSGFISFAMAAIVWGLLSFLHCSYNLVCTALAAGSGGISSYLYLKPEFKARECFEKIVRSVLKLAALVAILITLAIILTLLFETIRFFKTVSPMEFLFGLQWNPQTSYEGNGHLVDHGLYGAVSLFTGTFLIMTIALIIAAPLGLLIAVYMREYARARTRYFIKPVIEILAGIPTIVYGFFALVVVMPFLQNFGEWIGVEISSQSALGVGIVMGLMIIPYISSLSDDALGTVPQSLRDNSLALGATVSETIKRVVIPAASPGIITAFLLAISRAVGETMLVVMAAGLTAHLTFNPLEPVTTVTVQIVSLLTGDQEFNSPKTLSAFALGMTLFLVTLMLNIISVQIIKRYRDKYDT